MAVHQHIIRKQTIEVAFEGAIEPFAFKEQLALLCHQKLFPAIEKALNEKVPKDKVIKAASITIDVGELPSEDWEKVFCEKVVEQLLSYFFSLNFSSGVFSASGNLSSGAGNIEKVSEQENSAGIVLHFLRTGLLPWNAFIQTKEKLQSTLIEALTIGPLLTQVVQNFSSNPVMVSRLIQQFDEPVLDQIVALCGVEKHHVAPVKKLLFSLFNSIELPKAEQKMLLYKAMLLKGFEGVKKTGALIRQDNFEAEVFKEVFLSFSKEQSKQAVNALHLSFSEQEKHAKQLLEEILIGGQKTTSSKQKPDLKYSSSEDLGTAEEYFLMNAGLVILHPFLSSLFENIGYTKNKVWLNEEVKQRALVLSQYLVTGNEQFPEFNLLLNKILLGYPLNESLAGDIVLSDFEKQEAYDLLLSITKHWAALRNTSVVGLQTTFLQREGKIWFNDSRYYLKVTQKTVDILMNKLPWGLSIVKTPWMESMMHVEWN